MKKGFSLITAIVFIVIVATLGLFSLNISTLTAKQTSDIFLREQAELLAQSATEIAILEILKRDIKNKPSDCPVGEDVFKSAFKAGPEDESPLNVKVKVVQMFGRIGSCGTAIATPESAATIVLDVSVEKNSAIKALPPIRIYRRTIQKL